MNVASARGSFGAAVAQPRRASFGDGPDMGQYAAACLQTALPGAGVGTAVTPGAGTAIGAAAGCVAGIFAKALGQGAPGGTQLQQFQTPQQQQQAFQQQQILAAQQYALTHPAAPAWLWPTVAGGGAAVVLFIAFVFSRR